MARNELLSVNRVKFKFVSAGNEFMTNICAIFFFSKNCWGLIPKERLHIDCKKGAQISF